MLVPVDVTDADIALLFLIFPVLLYVLWIVATKDSAHENGTIRNIVSPGSKAGTACNKKRGKLLQKFLKGSKAHGQPQAAKKVSGAGCHCASIVQLMNAGK